MFHTVVLSLDRKSVALRNAYDQGGKLVYMDDFDASSLSLAEFIKARMRPKLKAAADVLSAVTKN